jgi:hypothetical protein
VPFELRRDDWSAGAQNVGPNRTSATDVLLEI